MKTKSAIGIKTNRHTIYPIFLTPDEASRIARQLRNEEPTDRGKRVQVRYSDEDDEWGCDHCGELEQEYIMITQTSPTVCQRCCHSCADDIANELEEFAEANADQGIADALINNDG